MRNILIWPINIDTLFRLPIMLFAKKHERKYFCSMTSDKKCDWSTIIFVYLFICLLVYWFVYFVRFSQVVDDSFFGVKTKTFCGLNLLKRWAYLLVQKWLWSLLNLSSNHLNDKQNELSHCRARSRSK